MADILYLSHVLEAGTPLYGGATGVFVEREKSIAAGDSCNTQRWSFPNHAGTHLDAPQHFFDHGKSVDGYDPSFWICGRITLVDVPLDASRLIAPTDVEGKIPVGTECLLIRTGWEKFRRHPSYVEDNPGLSPELGGYLREKFPELRFVGVDFISISRIKDRSAGRAAHGAFLNPEGTGSPVLPIEDMALSMIGKGRSITRMWVVPLVMGGADGAPVTVLAELA